MSPLLGCIADDVTGASDLASALTNGGMRTELWLDGYQPAVVEPTVDAIVIALKTRSIEADDAVQRSLNALQTLQACGVQQILFKYCSTFDSTDTGNIGPVAEALMEALEAPYTIFCPATPENGRTVYCGQLFANGKLLHRSGMEHHPLNPMTESDLTVVLKRQSQRNVGLIPHPVVTQGAAAIASAFQSHVQQQRPLIVVDAIDEDDLQEIAKAVVTMPLVTSGSGLGAQLPRAYYDAGMLPKRHRATTPPVGRGNALVLAGSCSAATREQVAVWPAEWPSMGLDVAALLRGDLTLSAIADWARDALRDRHALIYSSSSPENVKANQNELGTQRTASALEEVMGGVARAVVADGIQKLLIAGGETSGAVVRAIGLRRFRIGPAICPGVPWMESLDEPRLAIGLKSGNFGDAHFFRSALEMLP
ncbi:3-oxo-tetronate kinase [Bremerella sp. JC770]|uniref:3-oxo-tetronate kinase n=1 Tax=Bremerella sp. JC770 TaxID=3232137 RepID=UPI00345AC1FE